MTQNLTSFIPRCDELNFCSLNANLDELEEDPCPKTEKYLEAHYVCHSLIDGPPVQGWSNVTRNIKIIHINIVDMPMRKIIVRLTNVITCVISDLIFSCLKLYNELLTSDVHLTAASVAF